MSRIQPTAFEAAYFEFDRPDEETRPMLCFALYGKGGIGKSTTSANVALALSEGGETRQPMSVAVIGGLTTSTLLTLLVIPVVYLIFDDITDRVKASIRRFNAYRRLKSHGRGA